MEGLSIPAAANVGCNARQMKLNTPNSYFFFLFILPFGGKSK